MRMGENERVLRLTYRERGNLEVSRYILDLAGFVRRSTQIKEKKRREDRRESKDKHRKKGKGQGWKGSQCRTPYRGER